MKILAALMLVTVASVEAFSCTCLGPSQAKTMREVAAWYLNRPDAVLIVEGKKAQIGSPYVRQIEAC